MDHKNHTKQYGIPRDNPFIDEPNALPEIYAYGIRNIWRCGKDKGNRETGKIETFVEGGGGGDDCHIRFVFTDNFIDVEEQM